MAEPLCLLLVEDSIAEARLLREALADTPERFSVCHVEQLTAALDRLREQPFDAVLLDLSLPDSRGIETVEQVLAQAPQVPILVLTGLDDEALAMEAIRKGAQDYLVKGEASGALLVRAIQYARERKRTEQALKEADRRKDEFLANISHELRTPMNAILGMTELALDEPISPAVRDYLETARASAQVLLALLNELLDFSRIEAGKFTLKLSPFRLRDVLDETMKVLAVRAHEKSLELACDLPQDLPDGLIGDPLRLRQVLMNLIGNAIKFTEQGKVVVRVSKMEGGGEKQGSVGGEEKVTAGERRSTLAQGDVLPVTASWSAESQSGLPPSAGFLPPGAFSVSPSATPSPPSEPIDLEFAVADTGIGISPEDQQRIFARFAQADASMTRHYSGTGLGLAIASSLARLMGGGIRVQSEVGRGSTFCFRARFESCPEFDLPPTWQQPPESPESAVRPLRILLAEDTLANRKLVLRLLSKRGHSVVEAVNGEEAICRVKGETFDVVLMDVQMPVMDGFEAVAAIRALSDPAKARVPIVALTAHAMKGDADRCLAAGMDAYLTKPVDSRQLTAVVERLARGTRFGAS